METALITGASSGIGLELAKQFARHGHPLFITAPQETELLAIARELERLHGVFVRIIPKDLAQINAADEIFDAVSREGTPIDILVNNAGVGHLGNFWELSMEAISAMIRINVESVVRLTRLFLPAMISRNQGKILNTVSVAAFEPGPLMATYHATKAFLLSLSESLSEELKGTAITVTALCPGVTDTDFISKAEMVDTQLFQRGHVMSPQAVAAHGYGAMLRGDPLCVVGGPNKALVFARRLMSTSTQARIMKKMYEPAPADKRKRHRGDVENAAEPADFETTGRR